MLLFTLLICIVIWIMYCLLLWKCSIKLWKVEGNVNNILYFQNLYDWTKLRNYLACLFCVCLSNFYGITDLISWKVSYFRPEFIRKPKEPKNKSWLLQAVDRFLNTTFFFVFVLYAALVRYPNGLVSFNLFVNYKMESFII